MSQFRAGSFQREDVHPMFRNLFPVASVLSLYDIDPADLRERGKKLIIIDVDNTLLPWRSEEIPSESIEWIQRAKDASLYVCLLSNTRNPARVQRIAVRLGVEAIRGRFKPNPAGYEQALRQYKVHANEAVMIGDQLFTDILGANRTQIDAIWVHPLTPKDFVGTKVSRFGERLARRFLHKGIESHDEANWLDRLVGATPVDDAKHVAVIPEKASLGQQFTKFAIVGGTSTVIDAGLHYLLMFYIPTKDVPFGQSLGDWLIATMPQIFQGSKDAFAASTPVLKVVTASLAILNSFHWNRRWTFGIRGRAEAIGQLQKFFLVSIIGMGLNTLLVTGFNNIIEGHAKRSWAIATLIATVVVAFWNFSGQKFFAFRRKSA